VETIRLSRFAFEAVAGEEEAGSEHVPVRMARAIRFYLSDRDADRPGWPFPPFLRDREAVGDVVLKVGIDEQLWRELEQEAERQEVSTPQMVEHVALYFAAEVNSGRSAARILADLDEADDETAADDAVE
jgi:hypothetical protein